MAAAFIVGAHTIWTRAAHIGAPGSLTRSGTIGALVVPMTKAKLMCAGVLLLVATGCARDEGLDNAGRACEVVDECYPDVEPGALAGDAQCLDRVTGGYCTHLCETDADCCAAEGECDDGIPQVCSPFESTGRKMCFLTCEAEVIGDAEENAYCQERAHPAFSCRSSGGGAANRKVCVP